MKLLVVGSLHLDVAVRAPHFPELDETVTGESVDYVFGGKGGNQAVAASRIGADVGFAGRIGGDAFGARLEAGLRDAHVDIAQLQKDDGASGMSAAIVDANGDYGAVIVSAANLRIDGDAIDIPSETGLVLLQNEVPEAANLTIAGKARAAGARVWLNAAPARDLSDDLVELLDLLIVNRVEAAQYPALPMTLPVLETLGADGVRFEGRTFPGYAVEVVSTHGAGDMFVGALAACVLNGAPMVDAIGFAQGAAALFVSSQRDERKNLRASDVNAFLANKCG
ncbi:MAG: ribokinase [Silicimonas sp.]|nr:ribokinase [Silicimonas sp.]